MKVTNNFTVEEFERSSTASKYKINNTIPNDLRGNLYNLCKELEVVRKELGKPIVISSGYRCKELNAKVGGANNSQHLYASAADLKCYNNRKLFDTIVKLQKDGKVNFRQIIWEYGTKESPNWVHVAVNDNKHDHKSGQILYYYS